MDIEMLIVNIAVLSLVIVPCFAIIYIGHKQYNKVGKQFQQEAKMHGLQIDEYDRWNQNAMGIDYKQQKILLVAKRDEQIVAEVFPLKNIKKSVLVPFTHSVKTANKPTTVLDKILLELTPFDGTDKIIINLFDSEYTFEQDYEMKHAEKWNKLINNVIVKPHVKQKAA